MSTISTSESATSSRTASQEHAKTGRGGSHRTLPVLLLVAGIALVIYLFRSIGWPSIAANLERIGAWRFLFLVALYTLAQAAFAVGWWFVVDPRPPLGEFPHLFGLYLAGDALNYLAPGGVAGEPVKAHVLGRRTGTGAALASLTLHKHADLLAQWALVAGGTAYALWRFPMSGAARLAAAAGVAGLGALLLVLTWAMRRGTYGPILRRVARWKPLAARLDRLHRSAKIVDDQIRAFPGSRKMRYLASAAFCFLGWCGGVLETWLILRFLFASADWGTAVAVEALSAAFNNMFLFVPGRAGSSEGVRTAVFLILGLPAAQGLAYALVRRGRELAWTLPGLAVLARAHALRLTRGARELPGLNGEETFP